MQGVHTVSDIVVQAVCWYVPGEHIEQGVQTVDPLVVEKLEPDVQDVHNVSEFVVQEV